LPPYPAVVHPHDEVGRVFYGLGSRPLENFQAQLKGLFAAYEPVPTRGQAARARPVLGAVRV